MHCEPALLARYDGFGSVARCEHGHVHVQLGLTTLTFSEAQYQRFVALLSDSAANFELERYSRSELASDASDHPSGETGGAEYPDMQAS